MSYGVTLFSMHTHKHNSLLFAPLVCLMSKIMCWSWCFWRDAPTWNGSELGSTPESSDRNLGGPWRPGTENNILTGVKSPWQKQLNNVSNRLKGNNSKTWLGSWSTGPSPGTCHLLSGLLQLCWLGSMPWTHLECCSTLRFNLPKVSHVTLLLCNLHWFPVAACFQFNTLVFVKGNCSSLPPVRDGYLNYFWVFYHLYLKGLGKNVCDL